MLVNVGIKWTMETIEQNVDGNWNASYVGGPARYITRDFTGVIGWFRFPYDNNSNSVNSDMNFSEFNLTEQNWHFTVGVDALNVRRSPSLNGEVVAVYGNGDIINYDSYCIAEGYVWISYIGASGNRNYVATGEFVNGANNCIFGSFE